MNKLTTIDKYIARLLMAGFFLPLKWQATAVIGCCGYFFLRTLIGKYPVQYQRLIWALLLGSVFFLYVFALPLTPLADRHFLLRLVGNRMSLLLLPLLLAVFSTSFGVPVLRELKYFVYACTAACALANLAFIWHFYTAGEVTGPSSHVAYRQFMEHATGLHPTYLSMYLAFAVCILMEGWLSVSRTAKFALLYVLLIFLLALLAKAPLIALCMIFIHYGYVHRAVFMRYKALLAGMLLAVAAGCFFIPFARQRIGEVFAFWGTAKLAPGTANSVYERQLIWHTDTGLLSKYWLTGTGPGRMLNMLDYRYLCYSIYHNSTTGYFDPHNEYFWQWLSFGIAGIGVLTAILVVHIAKAVKSKNHLYLYLMIILCITFATESVLSRQQGILFYAFFTSLLFFSGKSESRMVSESWI